MFYKFPRYGHILYARQVRSLYTSAAFWNKYKELRIQNMETEYLS
jgi:hypothetical protein